MNGGSDPLALLGQATSGLDITTQLQGFYQQVTSLVSKLTDVNATITMAQNIIVNDCSGIVHTNINGALSQATTIATQAANAAIDSNPKIQQILSGAPGGPDGYYGGGGSGCKCQCKCNRKTRRKKKAKRSKTRVRHN